MGFGQERILRRVVDDEVHHDRETVVPCGGDEAPEKIVRLLVAWTFEQRVQAIVVLHRIQTPGEPREVEGVQVDPIEPHVCDRWQMLCPVAGRTSEKRKQIVDARPSRHVPRFALFASACK